MDPARLVYVGVSCGGAMGGLLSGLESVAGLHLCSQRGVECQSVFADARSRVVVFVAHCVLNQNAVSDGTAPFPGCLSAVVEVLRDARVGIVQMPCPELHCLGLDRGNPRGAETPVVEENTRIRAELGRPTSTRTLAQLVNLVVTQVVEYRKHGFEIAGVVGVDRSPSCGVETTSRENQEVPGEGVFIRALRQALDERAQSIECIGIRASEPERSAHAVERLLDGPVVRS